MTTPPGALLPPAGSRRTGLLPIILGVMVVLGAGAYGYKLWLDATRHSRKDGGSHILLKPFPDGEKYVKRFRGFTLPPVKMGQWTEGRQALEPLLGDGIIFIQAVPSGTRLAVQVGVQTMSHVRFSTDFLPEDGWIISEGTYDQPGGGTAGTYIFQKRTGGADMEFWVRRD